MEVRLSLGSGLNGSEAFPRFRVEAFPRLRVEWK